MRYCSNCSCRLSRHCSPAELYCTAERTVLAGSARFHGQQPALPRAAARPAKPKLLFTTGRCSAVWRAVRGQAAGYSSIDTKSPPGVHLEQHHGGAVLRHCWQAPPGQRDIRTLRGGVATRTPGGVAPPCQVPPTTGKWTLQKLKFTRNKRVFNIFSQNSCGA